MKTKSEFMVAHGTVTHPHGAKCELCERVLEEYENFKEIFDSALKARIIDKINKKYDYLSETDLMKEIITIIQDA